MTQTLRLTSAGEVIAALGAGHAVIRLKVVRALRDRPDLIAAYGAEGAPAIVAELWRRLSSESESAIRALIVEVLGGVPMQAVLPRCIEALSSPGHASAVEAARILAGRDLTDLPPSLQIRVWLLTENSRAVEASLEETYAAAWLAELAGENRRLACRMLGCFGGRVLALLAPHSARCDSTGFAWLVGLLDGESLDSHVDLLRTALTSDSGEILEAAVKVCAANFDRLPTDIRQHAESLREHPHPVVRISACKLPADSERLLVRYCSEPDSRVRAALLRTVCKGDRGRIDVLTLALESESWRERSAAVDAFVELGAPTIAHLRELVMHRADECKAGAWQALSRLGDDAWLESAAVLNE